MIGHVDSFCALDRGTVTIMPPDLFHTFPRNINDDEMNANYVPPEEETFSWKDTSYYLMLCEVLICQKSIDHRYRGLANFSDEECWALNKQRIDNLSISFQRKYMTVPDTGIPIQKYSRAGAGILPTAMNLLLRRPQCPRPGYVVPAWDQFDVLATSLSLLRLKMARQEEFKIYAWKEWVPWHALAVTLAEICTDPQRPLAREAWPVACVCFERYRQVVADSNSGMLWRPIARLMKRARRIMEGSLSGEEAATGQSSVVDANVDLNGYIPQTANMDGFPGKLFITCLCF